MSEELTAFVREVVVPAGPDRRPVIDPSACRFELRAGASPIHRWGIFAAETIPARRRVIEYTGQRIGLAEGRRRSMRPMIYIFVSGKRTLIDGAIGGSGAEFVNHSCSPNLIARLHSGRIWMVSLRTIEAGEELLIDYQITGTSPMHPCHCGSPNCRGYLNKPLAEPEP